MSQRTNAGYIITDSVHVGDTEFVLGVSQHGAITAISFYSSALLFIAF